MGLLPRCNFVVCFPILGFSFSSSPSGVKRTWEQVKKKIIKNEKFIFKAVSWLCESTQQFMDGVTHSILTDGFSITHWMHKKSNAMQTACHWPHTRFEQLSGGRQPQTYTCIRPWTLWRFKGILRSELFLFVCLFLILPVGYSTYNIYTLTVMPLSKRTDWSGSGAFIPSDLELENNFLQTWLTIQYSEGYHGDVTRST